MIKDLKELQELLKLCRKQGVMEINLQGVIVKFGDLPRKNKDEKSDGEDVPTEGLTEEQLMFFSVGGEPPA